MQPLSKRWLYGIVRFNHFKNDHTENYKRYTALYGKYNK